MPKPIKIRTTSNPIGQKFHQVMADKGMSGDYKALALEFGVRTPSVYDWIDHARIGKDKYPRLVEWSGRDLHWWFDIPAPVVQLQAPVMAREQVAVWPIKERVFWPFTRAIEAYERLSNTDKGRIDGYITGLIDAREGNGANSKELKANGAKDP